VSKPRSKKRPDKSKRKKRQATDPAQPDGKPAAKRQGASTAGIPRGSHPTRMWTKEAKREAVALLERGEVAIEKLAAELGVGARALREWQQHFEQEENDKPMTPEERLMVARLRRENERLRMENEILKKAATFFAKHRS
jgi:transposase-like protein